MVERIRRPRRVPAPAKKPAADAGKGFTPAKGNGNGKGFEPGHQKSLGNRGAEFRSMNRFLTVQLRNKLMEIEDPKKRYTKAHKLIDLLWQLAESGGEDGGPNLGAIREIFDRTEGKALAALALSGGDTPVEIVTANVPLEELASHYGSMIGAAVGNGHDD